MSGKPPLLAYPALPDRLRELMAVREFTASSLIRAAGVPRQQFYQAYSEGRASAPTLERLANALGVTEGVLTSGDPAVALESTSEGMTATMPLSLPHHFSPRARAFVYRFLAELSEAGAMEEELTSARNLLTRPDNYTYNFDGRRQEMTDDDHLLELEAMTDAIRLLLVRRREKRGLPALRLHAATR
ncbi:hypothetical protein rosag_15580 [Roseisolibacter agri]|uniref:HTH cro/C1-type domain-containing protein n=1 Tax=Roseisolibacter agri TaxID=2014610 RepID=A0AA37V0S0_9BACT|nr:hypothetical protein rosag_15580 [Roseisolibacter agri]